MKLIFFFLICLPVISRAQVDADFTVSDSSGCTSLMVCITNLSTGSGTLAYSWDFGNGQTSSLQNPWCVNYLTPGAFTITLTVTNGSETDVCTQLIQVFAKPSAAFSYTGTTQGCIPLNISFFDQSTIGSAPISSWNWDFGTGDVSNMQNPQYTYSQPGVFGVFFQVTDTNGCSSGVLIDPAVSASTKPVVQFSANPANGCVVPLDVQFTNNTTGNSPLQFNWDFGDGNSSTQQDPLHTYTALGVYSVTLSVIDAYGCSADTTIPGMINISDVTASFITSTGYMTLCPNQVFQFINTSGNSTVYWDFGNGATSIISNPWMIYPNPGIFNVTLIAGYGLPCADTIVVPITVQDVQTSVLVDPPSGYSCQLPATFILSYNGSTSADNFQWTVQTPLVPISSDSSSIIAQFTQSGIYYFSLIVTSQFGCLDTVSDYLIIDAITTAINIDTLAGGCIPYNVGFSSATYSNEPLTNWEWDFGDGNSSTQQNPQHLYTQTGEYTVTLFVLNDAGCTATATFDIESGSHQTPDFTISTDTTCAQNTVYFTNNTVDSTLVDTWTWSFGDNNFEPQWLFDTDTGYIVISLITNFNGCTDTLEIDSMLYVLGPIINNITPIINCDSAYKRVYELSLVDAHYWDWDMGDGTTFLNTTDSTVEHTYSSTGHYWVAVYAYNNSTNCVFKDSIQVQITDIIADFIPVTDTICYGTTLSFDASDSQNATQYSWTLDGLAAGTGVNPTIGPFGSNGTFPVQLIAYDQFGCADTADAEITVTRPVVDFVADTLSGCSPFIVELSSLSYSNVGVSVCSWNFGDATPPDSGNTVQHIYNITNTYAGFDVTLTVTDSIGCINSYTKPQYITLSHPLTNYSCSSNTVCLGSQIVFYNSSSAVAPSSYYWDFGNSTNSILTSPTITYTQSGIYTVSLTVTDSYGCTNTLISPDYIEIQKAIADFTVISTDTNCYPFMPVITNNSPIDFGPVYEWDFGDGFISQSHTPFHTYSLPGDYWMVYTITTSAGCTDNDSVLIHVGGPFAYINIIPDSTCLGEEVVFSMTDSINIQLVNWNFGDGSGSHDFSTSHIYSFAPPNNEFYISMIYCSEPTCCMAAESDTIVVHENNTLFSFSSNPSGGNSVPLNVQYINNTTGNLPLQFLWDFGDGGSSTQQNPLHTYVNFGTYTVSLSVTDNYGCTSDTTITGMIVITDVYAPFISDAGIITVFPNPTSDFAIIELPEFSKANDLTLIIYDVNGNIVGTEKIKATQTKIDTGGFTKGIYFLKVLNKNGVSVAKMVIQ